MQENNSDYPPLEGELSQYNPSIEQTEFYEMYGEDYTEWFPFASELREQSEQMYPWRVKDVGTLDGLIRPMLSPYNVYFMNKALKPHGLAAVDIFRRNSDGLRSDEFKKEHDGLHVLFAGCSVTFGDGMLEDYIWPKIVYDKMSKDNKMSGLYNLGVPGFNHVDIISQIFKYIDLYSNPDVIFINFPDMERQISAGLTTKAASQVVYTMYLALELYCKSNDIRPQVLISLYCFPFIHIFI